MLASTFLFVLLFCTSDSSDSGSSFQYLDCIQANEHGHANGENLRNLGLDDV